MDLTLRLLPDLYAGVRPITIYPNVGSPLRRSQPGSIDLVLIRENVEGFFAFGKRWRRVKTEKGLDSGRGRRYVINRLVSRPFLSRGSSFQAGIAQW
ncbi:MAG: isocitrate/isopropylmalate family dehydrogenase [Candidatus Methylomirabilales bacterium]